MFRSICDELNNDVSVWSLFRAIGQCISLLTQDFIILFIAMIIALNFIETLLEMFGYLSGNEPIID
jgi:hypothetical protein